MPIDAVAPTQITVTPTPEAAPPDAGDAYWGGDGFSFDDLLDLINPFQQIPIVSTLYRAATGDAISAGARILGGTLLGGPIGFAVAAVNAIVEGETGKDVGANLLALFEGSADATLNTALAEAESSAKEVRGGEKEDSLFSLFRGLLPDPPAPLPLLDMDALPVPGAEPKNAAEAKKPYLLYRQAQGLGE